MSGARDVGLGKDWITVTPSQFSHESEGLNYLRNLLPDEPPFSLGRISGSATATTSGTRSMP